MSEKQHRRKRKELIQKVTAELDASVKQFNKMSKVERPHLVPKGYLKLFSQEDNLVFAYDCESGEPLSESPIPVSKLAIVKKFYSMPDLSMNITQKREFIRDIYTKSYKPFGTQKDAENLSSRLVNGLTDETIIKFMDGSLTDLHLQKEYETPGIAAIHSVLSKLDPIINDPDSLENRGRAALITSEERYSISEFISVQMMRTLLSREKFKDLIEKWVKDTGRDKLVRGHEKLREYKAAHTILAQLSMIGNKDNVSKESEKLYNMEWRVLINCTDIPLIVSDHPSLKFNEREGERIRHYFPLSSNVGLLFWEELPTNKYDHIDLIRQSEVREIRYLNKEIYTHSPKMIYSSEFIDKDNINKYI